MSTVSLYIEDPSYTYNSCNIYRDGNVRNMLDIYIDPRHHVNEDIKMNSPHIKFAYKIVYYLLNSLIT